MCYVNGGFESCLKMKKTLNKKVIVNQENIDSLIIGVTHDETTMLIK